MGATTNRAEERFHSRAHDTVSNSWQTEGEAIEFRASCASGDVRLMLGNIQALSGYTRYLVEIRCNGVAGENFLKVASVSRKTDAGGCFTWWISSERCS